MISKIYIYIDIEIKNEKRVSKNKNRIKEYKKR